MTKYIRTSYNQTLAYNKIDGKKTGIMFLSGYKSDMSGEKAIVLENWAKKNNHSFLRFDYTGHGKSSGDFNNLLLSDWIKDVLFIKKKLTSGPQIIIGSSMGGWLMLYLLKHKLIDIEAIIGIAAAPDFTRELIWNKVSFHQKKQLIKNKILEIPNEYDEGSHKFSYEFIKDSFKCEVMKEKIFFSGKVFLYHGMKDNSVPYQTSIKIAKNITGTKNIKIILEKEGKHRLSEENEKITILKILEEAV